MKLTRQQWLIVVVLFLAFIIAMGVMAASTPKNVTETKTIFVLSTSTPKPDISATGWWDAIPTDPSLPTMPNGDSPTATPPQTSVP